MAVEEQLQPGEEILYRAHPTQLPLIPWFVVCILSLGVAAFAWGTWDMPPVAIAAGILGAVFLGVILIKRAVLRSHDYVLTNRRVIQEEGIFSRRSMDASLGKINNVEHRQTLWGRLLGYGDVEIDTASETGTTRFPQINHPVEFKRAVLGAAEEYRVRGMMPNGIMPNGIMPNGMPMAAPAAPELSPAERIRQLKGLLDEGLISPQEFEAKRRALLERI
jgi:membrane protein YdbS with pleckstrin-like domain